MSTEEDDFAGFDESLISKEYSLGKVHYARVGTRRKFEVESNDKEHKMTRKKTKKDDGVSDADSDAILDPDRMDDDFSQDTTTPTPQQKQQKTTNQTNTGTKPKPKGNKYIDEWIKNRTHTTFFIERDSTNENDKTNQNNITDKTQDQNDNKKQTKPLHAMELGKILFDVGVKNFKELKFAGKGKFRITFDKPRDAETMINSSLLKEQFKLCVYVPKHFQETIGVVRNVAPTLSEQDILQYVQVKHPKIAKVERIKKFMNGELKPTFSIKVFVKGQQLPDKIEIYGVTENVDIYVFPVKLCNRCLRYGHKEKICKSTKSRCSNCGMEHDKENCNNQLHCVHCSGNHSALDKNCPEKVRQNQIQYVMATEKLTFIEAIARFPKNSQTQPRLQSPREFPLLTPTQNQAESSNRQTYSKIATQPRSQNSTQNTVNTQEPTTNTRLNYIPISEVNRIVQEVKTELLKQLKLDTIIEKITKIQNNINKHNKQHKNKPDPIDSEMLLSEISSQIRSIISPEVVVPDTETHPIEAALSWGSIET